MLHIFALAFSVWLIIFVFGRVFLFVLKFVVVLGLVSFVVGLCCAMTGCQERPEYHNDNPEKVHTAQAFQAWLDACQTGSVHWEALEDPNDGYNRGFVVGCTVGKPGYKLPQNGE